MTHGAPTRRDFLAASASVLAVSTAAPAKRPTAERCVFLVLTGGPSHLDTFDPKPDALADVRGPFRAIQTRVPGVIVSELLPRLADRANRVAFVRSVCHAGPPMHEVGLQLIQTGRFAAHGSEPPHVGARLAEARHGLWHLLPDAVGWLGLNIGCGQSMGPSFQRPGASFVANCGQAVQLVEAGAACVCVNSFTGVFDRLSWDCHADGGRLATTLDDYRTTVAPDFDHGFALLLDGLSERGLLDSTLVVAAGEFGRTPYLNPRGGRDHWARCWSVLFAGGGVRGGAVLGASDSLGGEPADDPVPAAAIAATVLYAVGMPSTIPAEPLHDLFG